MLCLMSLVTKTTCRSKWERGESWEEWMNSSLFWCDCDWACGMLLKGFAFVSL
jgi:hypothetical protein